MTDFYRRLRKAELHVHLEGAVEPETVLELNPSLTLEEVRSRYAYRGFQGFIQSYIWINRQLKTPADYALITRRLLERLERENVTYAEINVSAGVILWKQQDIASIMQALAREAEQSKVEVRWIFDAVRQFGAEDALRVARLAVEYRDVGVVGFGIGGAEDLGPCAWFGKTFEYAKAHGLAVLPHAGETVGSESVWAAVRLGANRIGHGIRAVEDPELLEHLREYNIPLEVCITSNVCTGAVDSLEQHPVRRLYDAGVPITLNTDDPALFRTTLSGEYRVAAEHFAFTEAELTGIAQNAFRYSVGAGSLIAVDLGSAQDTGERG
jgi:adenosine deaminase/aminodeoxyfutalosine deaminase